MKGKERKEKNTFKNKKRLENDVIIIVYDLTVWTRDATRREWAPSRAAPTRAFSVSFSSCLHFAIYFSQPLSSFVPIINGPFDPRLGRVESADVKVARKRRTEMESKCVSTIVSYLIVLPSAHPQRPESTGIVVAIVVVVAGSNLFSNLRLYLIRFSLPAPANGWFISKVKTSLIKIFFFFLGRKKNRRRRGRDMIGVRVKSVPRSLGHAWVGPHGRKGPCSAPVLFLEWDRKLFFFFFFFFFIHIILYIHTIGYYFFFRGKKGVEWDREGSCWVFVLTLAHRSAGCNSSRDRERLLHLFFFSFLPFPGFTLLLFVLL